ncbi:MAG: hypothetical protein ACE5F1_13175 [Planctomycetota bacterium]
MNIKLFSLGTEIDRALRGEYTDEETLRTGKIEMGVRDLVQASLLLGMVYGLCMGLFPITRDAGRGGLQMAATMLKVPLLFLLTLLVTFPSLYVFSALAGSRLGAKSTLRLLVVAIAVNLAVVAGFGPVTAFFVLCTKSYSFIKLLNVAMFAIGGVISLVFLRRTLAHVFGPGGATPKDRFQGGRARQIFGVWIVVYGIVGAQMGWVLRPFIGAPELPFQLFRARESSFFQDLVKTFGDFLS